MDAADSSQPDAALRSLRHDIRGRLNALILCATALDETIAAGEAVEFLTHIEQTSDKIVALLDQLDAMA
jgi:signal transduction histidine kinase